MTFGTRPPKECPLCESHEVGRSTQFRGPKWPTWWCANCAVAFVWPLPSPDQLSNFYRWDDYTRWLYERSPASLKLTVRRMESYLVQLERHGAQPPGSLLDVGCSVGFMLEAAAARGWSVSGIELDLDTARRTSDRLHCEVLTGSAESILPIRAPVDVVVLSHSLEHNTNPIGLLQRVAQSMKIGGHLLIRVPNAESRLAACVGDQWSWYCPPIHLFYFTGRSFQTISARLGLTVVGLWSTNGDALPLPIELAVSGARAFLGGLPTPQSIVGEQSGKRPSPRASVARASSKLLSSFSKETLNLRRGIRFSQTLDLPELVVELRREPRPTAVAGGIQKHQAEMA
jgi:SAM-dependent methyltransferase